MQPDPRLSKRPRKIIAGGCAVAVLLGFVAWKGSVGQRILDWAIAGRHFTVARVLSGGGLNPDGHPQVMHAPPLFGAAET